MAIVRHVTLVASVVTTVTLPTNAGTVECTMRATGAADTFITTDNTTPSVAGNDCTLLAGIGGAVVVLPDETPSPPGPTVSVVKLVSAGAPSVAIRAG
jgi:hypothetical protein